MTVKEYAEDIGKQGIIWLGGLKVEVNILDVKNSYGRNRWLVTPVRGSGEVWVENIDIYHSEFSKKIIDEKQKHDKESMR